MNFVQRMIAQSVCKALGFPVGDLEDTSRNLLSVRRGNDPLAAALNRMFTGTTAGDAGFTPTVYGDYYPTSVPVYRAIKLRSDAVSRAPLQAFTRQPDGELEWVGEEHPVQELLDSMNPWWSHADIWRGVETYLSIWGSAFLWINKPSKIDVTTWEIWLLRPDKVAVIKDKEKYIKGFVHDPHGSAFAMMPDEIVWFRYFNPLDEFSGLSPLAPGRMSIEMQLEMVRVNRQLFKNGVLAQNFAFLMNAPLDDSDVELFYNQLEKRHSGSQNSNRPIVMSKGDGEVKNLGFSNREMEFFQGLTFSLQEVARIYSVPPTLMFDLTQSIFNNVSEARADFHENTVTQEWSLLEAGMQERFLPILPAPHQGLILKFNKDGIEALQENLNQKALRQQADITAGVLTINEVRRDRGLPEVPWGDSWWINLGLVQADKLVSGEISVTPGPEGTEEGASMEPTAIEGKFRDVSDLYKPSNALAAPPQSPIAPRPHQLYAKVEQKRRLEETEARDRQIWESFIRQLEEHTPSFEDMQKQLFVDQQEDVLRKARRAHRNSGLVEIGDIFQPTAWTDRFKEAGKPAFQEALSDAAAGQIHEFNLKVEIVEPEEDVSLSVNGLYIRQGFNIFSAITQAWLDERTAFWASRVNDETSLLLIDELREAAEAGDSIRQIQGRISEVFEISEELRTERIARTEMTVATNEGHLQAYVQAGVRQKRWLAELDGRVRPAHRRAHGQIVDIEDPFTVGGEALRAPGQGGSAQNVINCRCTTTPIVE